MNTKSMDGQQTLLHFVAESLERQRPDECAFTEHDWRHLPRASKASLDLVQKQLNQMKQSVKKVSTVFSQITLHGELLKFRVPKAWRVICWGELLFRR